MSKLPKQTSRKDLIRRFKDLGFSGPHSGGGKHAEFMTRGTLDVKISNDHGEDIGEPLLKRILSNAGIDEDTWLSAGKK